jgi:hypothetical protein
MNYKRKNKNSPLGALPRQKLGHHSPICSFCRYVQFKRKFMFYQPILRSRCQFSIYLIKDHFFRRLLRRTKFIQINYSVTLCHLNNHIQWTESNYCHQRINKTKNNHNNLTRRQSSLPKQSCNL